MKIFAIDRNLHSGVSLCGKGGVLLAVICLAAAANTLRAQTAVQADFAQRIEQLTDSMTRTQAQLERSQRELDEMRRQLAELRRAMAMRGAPAPAAPAAAMQSPASVIDETSSSMAEAIQDLREQQAIQESQIATQEQTKVESESKYPVKVTGMVLLTAFANTSAVDTPATPSVAIGGSGSAGATVHQTVIGFDARGPHVFGAHSFADLRVDFSGAQAQVSATGYQGYLNSNSPMLRLRTAHAGLEWSDTQVQFALDRPIISPDTPTSLTAVAVPALAWSGNLWTWNPQAVVTQNLLASHSAGLEMQAALIDVGDAPLTPQVTPYTPLASNPPSSAEQSSKPGVEARLALAGPDRDGQRIHLGAGGYFAEHNTALGYNFDSWAATLDARLLLGSHVELTGNFYRGAALGGLGAGAYKDFALSPNPYTGGYYFRPLDDVGGWAQLKVRAGERLQFNAADGMDNVFSGQLRPYYVAGGPMIQNLARNRTITGNAIYSPSAYLLFSLEYRRLDSAPVEGPPAGSNIVGIGAGYKF